MKVTLVFPPQFDPTIPNLALPCLTPVLRAAGHEVIQKDLNVESYDHLLSKEELAKAAAEIDAKYPTLRFLNTDSAELERLIQRKDFLLDEIENAKRVWRDPVNFYDYQRFTASKRIMEDGLKFVSLPYFRTRLSFTQYEMYYSPDSTEEILKAVRDSSLNLYHDYYLKYTLPELTGAAPQVVGISISSRSQVIPGLTLAYLLKQAIPTVHIVIGGIHFTNLRENLARNHGFFSLADSVILFEGETALTKLVDCLENGGALQEVPNLIFRDGGQIIVNELIFRENLNQLPTPLFEGLPLELYFAPQPVFMIYASRGCYWGRCAFCNHSDYTGNRYRLRSPQKVREDMAALVEKHGAATFGLVDLAVSPRILAGIAAEIIESGLQINWFCMARFERKLDQQLCARLAKSGLKMLLFGLESGSERVLSAMDKGTNPALINEVLAATHEAGIANFVSCFFGFPTETLDEAKDTIRIIQQNLKRLISITIQKFELDRNSRIHRTPEFYQVHDLFLSEGRDLAWGYDYKAGEGLAPKEAAVIANGFYQICGKYYTELFNIFLPYLLYIIYYRRNDLFWLTPDPVKPDVSATDPAQKQRSVAHVDQKLTELLRDLQ